MPSPIISDINPNSLGALQPIRGVGVQPSIPTPLNITPYIQGQSVVQNERQLDQNDLRLSLEQKKFEFLEGQYISQEIDKMIGSNNQGINDYITEQKQSGGGNFSETLGLNSNRPAHKALLDTYLTEKNNIVNKYSKSLTDLWKNGSPKLSDTNSIKVDMGREMTNLKQRMSLDPKYMKFAKAEKSFQEFNSRVKKLQEEKGLTINTAEYNKIAKAYDDYTSGSTDYTLGMELSKMTQPEFLQNIFFDRNKANEYVKLAATEVFKPIDEVIPQQDIGNGILASVTKSTVRNKEQGTAALYEALINNRDVVQMVETASGYTIDTKEGQAAFKALVNSKVLEYSRPDGMTSVIKEVKPNVDLFDRNLNTQKLELDRRAQALNEVKLQNEINKDTKDKNGKSINSLDLIPNASTQEDRELNELGYKLRAEGIDPNSVNILDLRRVMPTWMKTPDAFHKELNKETGKIEIWQVQVDENGVRPPDNNGEPIKIKKVLEFNPYSEANKTEVNKSVGSNSFKISDNKSETVRSFIGAGESDPNISNSYYSVNGNDNDWVSIGKYQFNGKENQRQLFEAAGKLSEWESLDLQNKTPDQRKEAINNLFDSFTPEQESAFAEKQNQLLEEKYIKPVNDKLEKDFPNFPDELKPMLYDMNVQHGNMLTGKDNLYGRINKYITKYESSQKTVADKELLAKEIAEERIDYVNDYAKEKDKKGIINRRIPLTYENTLKLIRNGKENQPTPTSTEIVAPIESSTQLSQPNIDPIKSKLIKGEDISINEINDKVKELTGHDIDYIKGSGNAVKGPSVIGTMETQIQVKRGELERINDRFVKENIKREDEGKPLLGRIEDYPEYFKKSQEIQKLESELSSEKNKYLNAGKFKLVEEFFPDEVKTSYSNYANSIITDVEDNRDIVLNLSDYTNIKGTIEQSEVNPTQLIIKYVDGKKERIDKSDFKNWIEKNAKEKAVELFNPIQYVKVEQPTQGTKPNNVISTWRKQR